jgi:hypothetical protein
VSVLSFDEWRKAYPESTRSLPVDMLLSGHVFGEIDGFDVPYVMLSDARLFIRTRDGWQQYKGQALMIHTTFHSTLHTQINEELALAAMETNQHTDTFIKTHA